MDVLRPWSVQDAASLAAALNNKNILDNLRDGLPYPYTAAHALEYITDVLAAPEGSQYTWAITHENTAVGSIGVFRQQNIHSRSGEMGYYVAQPYWGRGLGTAAVTAACRFVFENTDIIRIFATPFSRNTASCRILEKAGFQREGTLRSHAVKNNLVQDMEMYALIKE